MSGCSIHPIFRITTLLATMALAGPAAAAPPDHAGGPNKAGQAGAPGKNRGAKHERDDDIGVEIGVFFDARHRTIIHDYYGDQLGRGHCPPGLAKKGNGCQPPGQAKKWRIGRPLPHDVTYYDLPYSLRTRLGYDDPAYKLIRVGSDILRIGVGSGIVVEAVEDLGEVF